MIGRLRRVSAKRDAETSWTVTRGALRRGSSNRCSVRPSGGSPKRAHPGASAEASSLDRRHVIPIPEPLPRRNGAVGEAFPDTALLERDHRASAVVARRRVLGEARLAWSPCVEARATHRFPSLHHEEFLAMPHVEHVLRRWASGQKNALVVDLRPAMRAHVDEAGSGVYA